MFENLLKISRLSPKPAEHDLHARMPARIGKLEEDELEIPTETASGIPSSAEILKIAREDPRKTSALIHNWLRQR